VLSLDVVLGSIAVGLFAVTLLEVEPVPEWWFILPMAVWVVYTLDHLVDGFRLKNKSTIYRHQFHYKYRHVLGSIVLVNGLIALYLSFRFLETRIIIWGSLLSAFIILYLLAVYLFDKYQLNQFLKEFFIAFVYITGIFLAPLIWNPDLPDTPELIAILFLFVIAWFESIIISYYDFELDIQNDFKSFTVAFGKINTRKILITGLLLLMVMLIISILLTPNPAVRLAYGLELFMAVIILLLILYPEKFRPFNRYRWVGESVFYLPALFPVFSRLCF
jgi:hypothetical protein